MNGALWFLLTRSFANSVRHRILRLRQPKYLLGAVFGGFYCYFYFYRFLFRSGRAFGQGAMTFDPVLPDLAAAVYLLAVLLFAWIFPAARAALRFTEAEIAWLFPGPITRRTLLRFKLIKSQLGIVFFAVIMLLVSGRFRQGGLAWIHLLGWWIGLTIFTWHRIAASFVLQGLREGGLSDVRRRFALGFTLVLVAAIGWFTALQLPEVAKLGHLAQSGSWLAAARAAFSPWPLQVLLTPFRWCVQVYFASSWPALLFVLPPALGVLWLHYFWIMRAEASFEETSIALAQRRAQWIAAKQSGRRPSFTASKAAKPIFKLHPLGPVFVAFLWKSLLKAGGKRTLRRWFRISLGALLAGWLLQRGSSSLYLQMLLPVLAYCSFLASIVFCTQFAAGQFRESLGAADLLKSFPIRGWQFVLGDLIGPIAMGVSLQLVTLALIAMTAFSFSHSAVVSLRSVGMWSAGVALLLPAANLLLVLIPCVLTLLLPAWFKPGEQRTTGIEATGLRILMMLGQLLVLLLALILPAILGFGAGMALRQIAGDLNVAVLSGAAVGAVALSIEASWGLLWLGTLFERFDLNDE
jgi:hypothetical protein